MKKIILSAIGLSMCVSGFLFANEEPQQNIEPSAPISNEFLYLNLGLGPAPIPIPQFGVGFRCQRGSNGFDENLQITTIVEITGLKLGADYIHYINPNLNKQFYVGVGPAISALINHGHNFGLYLSPEFIFGKEYLSDTGSQRFFQASLIWPTVALTSDHYGYHHKHDHKTMMFPLLSFSYGWGF